MCLLEPHTANVEFFLGKFDDKVKIKSMIFCGKQPVIRKDDEM